MLVRNVDFDIGIPDSQITQGDRVIHGINRRSLGRCPLHDLREKLCNFLILPDLKSVCGAGQHDNAPSARLEIDAGLHIVHFRSERRDIRFHVCHDVALVNIVPAVLILGYPVDQRRSVDRSGRPVLQIISNDRLKETVQIIPLGYKIRIIRIYHRLLVGIFICPDVYCQRTPGSSLGDLVKEFIINQRIALRLRNDRERIVLNCQKGIRRSQIISGLHLRQRIEHCGKLLRIILSRL